MSSMNEVIRELNSLAEALKKIDTAKVARRVGPKIAVLIQAGFDKGTSPYDQPWRPLAPSTLAGGRHPPPLTDTGAMRNSVVVATSKDMVTITVGTHYAEFHQYGTKNMPRRPIVPWLTLPKSWEQIIADAWADELDAHFAGLGGKGSVKP